MAEATDTHKVAAGRAGKASMAGPTGLPAPCGLSEQYWGTRHVMTGFPSLAQDGKGTMRSPSTTEPLATTVPLLRYRSPKQSGGWDRSTVKCLK